MTTAHLLGIIAVSAMLGVALSVLSGLPRSVRLWLERRRIDRIVAGRGKAEPLHWMMACQACGVRAVAKGYGRCALCVGKKCATSSAAMAEWSEP